MQKLGEFMEEIIQLEKQHNWNGKTIELMQTHLEELKDLLEDENFDIDRHIEYQKKSNERQRFFIERFEFYKKSK
jgi:hypothetical protein